MIKLPFSFVRNAIVFPLLTTAIHEQRPKAFGLVTWAKSRPDATASPSYPSVEKQPDKAMAIPLL
jgi:hypothetical protein